MMCKQLTLEKCAFKKISLVTLTILALSACGGGSDPIQPNTGSTTGETSSGGSGAGGTAPPVDPLFDEVRSAARLERISNDSAAVSVAIYKDGEVVFAEAFGNNMLSGGTAVNTETLFQLGSTTKMFTSLATMQLVDQGMLSTEDTLISTVPGIEYPTEQTQGWNAINMHHMMTHQGGFLDEYETINDASELLHFMLNQYGDANPQMVDPGLFFNYSNPNFSFLGAVIEYFAQQDYREAMEEAVFESLSMTRTTMEKSDVISDGNFALGVYDDNGSPRGYNDLNQINDWLPIIPAGIYTWSTPTELLKMADFLLKGDNDVLSDELRLEMIQPHVSMDYAGLPFHYGYGIFVDEGFIHNQRWYPEKVWQHGGNTDGYTSKFWILPEKNVAVAVLSSGFNDNYANTMMAALESVTELPASQAIPYAETDISTYGQHVGTYHTGAITIEVSNNNGVLNVQVPELDEEGVQYSPVLTPVGGNTFLTSSEGDQVDVTFFTHEGSAANETDEDSIYIRNRGFVGIKAGNETSERPAKAKEMRTTTKASKIVLD